MAEKKSEDHSASVQAGPSFRIEGPGKERELKEFTKKHLLIGRKEDCDLLLYHETVSKHHARIAYAEDHYIIRDLDSFNGTYVNGKGVLKASLRRGDRLRIGRFELVFLGEKSKKASEAAPVKKRRKPAKGTSKRKNRSGRLKPKRTTKSPSAEGTRLPPLSRLKALSGRLFNPNDPRFSILPLGLALLLLLTATLVLCLLLIRGKRNEPASGSLAPDSESFIRQTQTGEENSKAIRQTGQESQSPGQALPASSTGALVGPFQREVEPFLISECSRCHNGMAGGKFLLYTDMDQPLQARLNLNSLLPYVDSELLWHSELFLKASGKDEHPGGEVMGSKELKKLASYFADPKFDRLKKTGLSDPRPDFKLRTPDAGQRTRVKFHRLFLDLIGRPPTDSELSSLSRKEFKEAVLVIVRGKEYSQYWNQDTAAPLKQLWKQEIGKTLLAEEAALRLAEVYERNADDWVAKEKTNRQLAASLLVDLWQRKPQTETVDLLVKVLNTLEGETLPLAAFLLGEVHSGENRSAWLNRLYLRFYQRLPGKQEKQKAMRLLERRNGARNLVLALSSSAEYYSY